MSFSDKMIYTVLLLVSATLIGMFTGSWRIILYPYLVVIGIAILAGLVKSVKSNPRNIWIPASVSLVFIMLYGWLDIITIDSPTGGTSYILGLTPSMAVYLLGIWPLTNLICLMYAWTFTYEESVPNS